MNDHIFLVIWVIKIFLAYFFCVFMPPLLNLFLFCWVLTVSVLYCDHPLMKRSFDTSNFLLFGYQFSSVDHSCPTLCDPMKCSTPGLPVHHQLPEFTQTHVHGISDAFQPSHPLLSSTLYTKCLYIPYIYYAALYTLYLYILHACIYYIHILV